MKLKHSNVPLTTYHGVPIGWSKIEILNAYHALGGFNLSDIPEATEPGAPNWLPDRYNWLQYRAAIRTLPALIRAGDVAAVELAIRYVELNYFGSYSGYLRARLARALKHPVLSQTQKDRLLYHFAELKRSGQCFEEFKEYKKLEKYLMAGENIWL